MLMAARLLKSALLYPCAEISRRRLLERFNPGDVSWIKPREVCTSEQKLEEVFTFRVAVYWPGDKTTKCFLSTGGNRRFRPLAQGYCGRWFFVDEVDGVGCDKRGEMEEMWGRDSSEIL